MTYQAVPSPYTATSPRSAAPRGACKSRDKRSDRIEYRLIFVAAFLVFFVTAVFERALPGHWMSRTGDAPRKSVFEQSREAAKISAAYAFMG
jgi:hypothetical protein